MNIFIFAYSFVTFRRLLKYDDYDLTTNSKGFGGAGNELEMGRTLGTGASAGRKRGNSVVQENPSTSYQSQTDGLKHEIDRVIGAEFGWGSGNGATSPNVTRSGSVVGSGTVHSAKVRPEGASRTQSWSGETHEEAEEEDDNSTIRGSYDAARHQSVPTLIVSGHEEDETDTQALLPDGSESDIVIVEPHQPQYADHERPAPGPSS